MVRGIDESPQGAGDGISDAEGGSVYGVVVRWRQGEMKPEESSANMASPIPLRYVKPDCLRNCSPSTKKLVLCRRRDDFAR